MFRNNKTIGLVLIAFLLIAGIYAQTNILAPPISISNNSSTTSDEDDLKTPKASDVSGNYDLGDGNTMDIDAVDNTTTTTLNNNIEGKSFPIVSEKNDTSTSTLINDTLLITTDSDKSLHMEDIATEEFNATISEKNQLDLYATTWEFHSNATVNDADNSLDSFYANSRDVPSQGFFNVSYIKDDVDGYDLQVLSGSPINYFKANLDYDKEADEYKWREDIFNPYITPVYTINQSGVWQDSSQVIDWTNNDLEHYSYHYENWIDPDGPGGNPPYLSPIYDVNITKEHNITIIHFYSYYPVTDFDFYELIFTRATNDNIHMDFVATPGTDIRFHWREYLLTLYIPGGYGTLEDYMSIMVYLWNIFDLVYIFRMEIAHLEIKFLKLVNYCIIGGVEIAMIYYSTDYFSINLRSIWTLWDFSIGIKFDLLQNIYLGYRIKLGYHFWTYIYDVPTLILPNFIRITIIESVYTDSWFYIKIRTTDFLGYAGSGAAITGTWDGEDIGTVDDNGDGTYNFTLPAKFVPSGGDPLWLNLTASGDGYANGTLNTEIAVEPLPPGPPPDPPKQLIIKIVESIYLDDSFNFTVEISNCSGDLESVLDDFSGEWDGDVLTGANITDNGDGTYDLAVTPIYVPEFGTPIWLNLTATKAGYTPGELNTEIAVEPFYTTDPPPAPKQLIIHIINSIYTTEWFNLTVEVINCTGDLEIVDSFYGFWNGTAIPIADITDNGDGTFNITLEAIIVSPGDPGILLSLTATKSGYFEGVLDTEIAVDPAAIDKAPGVDDDDDDGGGGERKLAKAPDYTIPLIIGGLAVIAAVGVVIFIMKKRQHRIIE